MTQARDAEKRIVTDSTPECCGRRDALRTVGVVAVAGVGLTACGADVDSAVGAAASSGASAAATAASGAVGALKDLAKKADIPVGGGTIIDSAKVVITQPTEGDYKAFSAVCPHQGCTVSSVGSGSITCACHGSMFDIATGDVKRGPATRGLDKKSVTVGADGISVT